MTANAVPPKLPPETVALRAAPRPVVRLNRRVLAVIAGALATLVLGATVWSLQPSRRERDSGTELFNVDRVTKSDGLERCRRRSPCARPAFRNRHPRPPLNL